MALVPKFEYEIAPMPKFVSPGILLWKTYAHVEFLAEVFPGGLVLSWFWESHKRVCMCVCEKTSSKRDQNIGRKKKRRKPVGEILTRRRKE
jgi:hypothetical protein